MPLLIPGRSGALRFASGWSFLTLQCDIEARRRRKLLAEDRPTFISLAPAVVSNRYAPLVLRMDSEH